VINWHTFFFILFAAIACGFSVWVLIARNVVRMAFYLVIALGATAGLFFLAGADFVGAMQLMIYVGGTLVLLIFGVMLTAQGPFVSMKTGGQDWILAALIGGALLALLMQTAAGVESWLGMEPAAMAGEPAPSGVVESTSAPIGLELLGLPTERLSPENESDSGASGYLLPFEIVSVHLLVVLIGAAYMARAKRRATSRG
jgi:NADH-quinone oxidoreductase subunit J